MQNPWMGRGICLWVAMSMPAVGATTRSRSLADEPGTVGIVVRQIFSETEPSHRGPLAVMHVLEDSPAAKAGIRCSDFILAVNGVAVPGRVWGDVMQAIQGPAGGSVRLTIATYEGKQFDATLVRVPFQQHTSRATDPFAYTIPGDWDMDPRYDFPLPWSPTLAYQGFEDLYYTPNFDRVDSPEYHSYLFFQWLNGAPSIGASQLEADMLVYFRGLAEERGRTYRFTPDLSQIRARYQEDGGHGMTFGGVTARTFTGEVSIWDTHARVIRLNSEVVEVPCPGSSHTAMFFAMSQEPRDGDVWKLLDGVRDTFRCGR